MILIAIDLGDAPPRGNQYCLDKIWCRKANSLDKEGPHAEELLLKMKELGIMYNILMINERLTRMIEFFKSMEGGEVLTSFEMTNGLEFDTITDSVINQIEKSVNYKNLHLNVRAVKKLFL